MKAIFFSTALALCTVSLLAQTPAQNKAKVMEFYKAFSGDIAKFNAASFVAADFTDETIPADAWKQMGADGISRFQAAIQSYKTSFDFQAKPLMTVAEGDLVMAYIECAGTFKSDFMGIKATNKSFKFMDVDIVQFNKEGKAVKHWAVQDPMVMWAQLGVETK